MKINVEKEQLVEKAGHALDEMIRNRGGKPLLFLTSGGSSLPLLTYIQESSLGPDVTIGSLDDRYSRDRTINSYAVIQDGGPAGDFYTKALQAGVTFLDAYPKEEESLEQFADRYQESIQEWIQNNPGGIIRATVGIGPDGHTSGVLPHPRPNGLAGRAENPEKFEKLFNGDRLIIGYDVENKHPHRYRMTSTFTFMRTFDQIITFMSGENKREALKKVLAEEGSLAETPGRIIRELKNVTLFTDVEI
jgi:6-phosphogluconolactonase/glucosamine-6-phosphate isomerase/deaminase